MSISVRSVLSRWWLPCLSVALCGLLAATAAAEAPAPGGDDDDITIVVTATRTPKAAAETPQSVTVIERAEIERMGAVTADEAVRRLAGVDVRQRGAAGSLRSVSLRGAAAEQVLVLMDGRRLNAAQGGGVDLTDIPLDYVERIEVLRGGASALYGADALGGVINIITRTKMPGVQGKLRGELGSFGWRRVSFNWGFDDGRSQLMLSASDVAADNDFSFVDNRGDTQTRINSELRQRSAFITWRARLNSMSRLTARAEYYDADKGVPGRIEFPSPNAQQTDQRRVLDVEHSTVFPSGAVVTARLYLSRQHRTFLDPGAIRIFGNHTNWLHGAELTGELEWAGARWAYGWDHRRESLSSNTVGTQGRTSNGLYVEGDWQAGRWDVVAAVRRDSHTGFGSAWSPQLGLLAHIGSRDSLRLNLRRAFRAPSFNDLYWPADAFAVGNPALRAETANGLEFGWSHRGSRLVGTATVFHQRVNDLIVWSPGAGGKWSPQNIGRAQLQGVELELQRSLAGGWTTDGTVTWLDAQDRSGLPNVDGMQLIGRPDYLAHLGLWREAAPWRLGVELHYTGRRFTTAANTQSLSGHTTVDLHVQRPWRGLTWQLDVLNLFDRQYRDIADFPAVGRELRLRVEGTF